MPYEESFISTLVTTGAANEQSTAALKTALDDLKEKLGINKFENGIPPVTLADLPELLSRLSDLERQVSGFQGMTESDKLIRMTGNVFPGLYIPDIPSNATSTVLEKYLRWGNGGTVSYLINAGFDIQPDDEQLTGCTEFSLGIRPRSLREDMILWGGKVEDGELIFETTEPGYIILKVKSDALLFQSDVGSAVYRANIDGSTFPGQPDGSNVVGRECFARENQFTYQVCWNHIIPPGPHRLSLTMCIQGLDPLVIEEFLSSSHFDGVSLSLRLFN